MLSEEQILAAKILIVDDQKLNIRILEEILRKAKYSNIVSTTDSRDTKELYQKISPDLLILDLDMPHLNGFQVMAQLSEIEGDNDLPILVISHEQNRDVRYLALESGAKDFIIKPYDRVEVLIRIRNLIETRMLHNELRDQNIILEQKIKERTKGLYQAQLDVIERLARAVEYRDSETGWHVVRMSHYASCLSAKVGLDMERCEMILTASLLHDVGKIGVPDTILQKKGKLTLPEWEIMKTHTAIGANILGGSDSPLLQMAERIALTHHEKWDGTGYPRGLKGGEIPLVGRICGLCDVFDALTSERPYKKVWPIGDALLEIQRGSGTHFDPILSEKFFQILPQIFKIRERYFDSMEKRDYEF